MARADARQRAPFPVAGVYPPAMKILATWFRYGRGLALGVLVGSLTLGKAAPYLINGIGSESWRTNVALVSLLAAAGALIVLFFISDGPLALPAAQDEALLRKARGVPVAEVGRSLAGREIYQLEFGRGPVKVFMWSQMHGDEPTATAALFDVFDYLRRHADDLAGAAGDEAAVGEFVGVTVSVQAVATSAMEIQVRASAISFI